MWVNKVDFVKKGMISTKYLYDGCEFKKVKNNYKLVSTSNFKYEPFLGKTLSESAWDLVSISTITSGDKYNEVYGLLLNHFKSGQTIFKKEANILLKKDEFVVYQSPKNITLKEPKSIRVTNSSHGGASHRRGKRSYGYGVSRSVGETKEVVKTVDTGQFIITNKRFIYSGMNRNIDVNISQIVGITPYADGFKLQRKGKKKPEYFINIDSHVFTYNFNNDTYFFIMNGHIIKSLIEGGLNKTPQKSKLQLLASQKQIAAKMKIIEFENDDFVLKYKSVWKKIANKSNSNILAIERLNPPHRAEIRIEKAIITEDDLDIVDMVKDILNQNGFKIRKLNNILINGIDMLSVSSEKNIDDKIADLEMVSFNVQNYNYLIYFTNNKVNSIAKKDYEEIINSITLKNQVDKGNDRKVNFCPNCGISISHDGNFCQNCGFKFS